MDLNTLFIVTFGLIAIVIFILVRIIILEKKLKNLLAGKNARSLEDTISNNVETIQKIDKRILLIAQEIDSINKRLAKAIQKVHVVRFNPFKDQGGNQSFATSFLDEKGDGVVISSLYSRDKFSVYAKPINSGKSKYELSEEEREAIDCAEQQI
ncbi:MAG: DUF4446 family protein [Candidatus Paceibacterota bacterium]|jgi:hypothetical protein